MPQAAPRYDPRLLAAARDMDDGSLPVAEICRRVGRVAETLGVPRSSYVHLRRLVRSERLRRAEHLELLRDVLDSMAHRHPMDASLVVDRLRDIDAHSRLRFPS